MESKTKRLPWAALLFAFAFGYTIEGLPSSIKWLIFDSYHPGSDVIYSLIFRVSLIALVVSLFINKRGIFTFAAIAFYCIFPIIFNLSTFCSGTLYIISGIALVGFALITCELSFVKIDTGITSTIKKLWFLPGILFTVSLILFYERNAESVEDLLEFFLDNCFECSAWFLLGHWLAYPYKEEKTVSETQGSNIAAADGYCSIGKLILLSIFTLGIWPLIWNYRTTRFLNQTPNAEHHNPTNKLLLCMFVPFYQIYWYYKQAQRADTYAKHKNPNHSDISTTCLVCAIFIPIVASVILQSCINSICTAPSHVAASNDLQAADTLERYKELLDQGIINQEEFDAKKKQLLGL